MILICGFRNKVFQLPGSGRCPQTRSKYHAYDAYVNPNITGLSKGPLSQPNHVGATCMRLRQAGTTREEPRC